MKGVSETVAKLAKNPRSTSGVKFDLFSKASPQGEQLVLLWHQKAQKMSAENRHDSFEAFIHLWIGFNNWGMRVTEAERDADMIKALAESAELTKAFADLLNTSDDLKTYAAVFAGFWPIFDVKDIRKKNLRYKYQKLDRKEYTEKLLTAHVRHAPEGAVDRNGPTWGQTVRAIYQVRCNLFHGEKGDSSDDYRIVEGAYRTLLTFIDGVNLYRWAGSPGTPVQPTPLGAARPR